jgi:hypothetical protein
MWRPLFHSQLTGHKTVTQFMRYVHTEDDPVRAAAETVATRRRIVISGQRTTPQAENSVAKTQGHLPGLIISARAVEFDRLCRSGNRTGRPGVGEIFREIEPEDLLKYGLIPEFV